MWLANAVAPEALLVAEGGAIVERLQTSQLCFACMLGGDDGKTLFAATACSADPLEAAQSPSGKIEYARVAAAHAGKP